MTLLLLVLDAIVAILVTLATTIQVLYLGLPDGLIERSSPKKAKR